MSAKVQSFLWALLVVPIVQIILVPLLIQVGGEQTLNIGIGVGFGSFCGVYAFGPSRWLADPEIAGWFGQDYPFMIRGFCCFGVIVGFGSAWLSA